MVFITEKTYVSTKPVIILLPAVDQEGKGILIPLNVESKPGTGKILMNIDNPSFILDTQESIRLAVKEAGRITGYDLSKVDIIFSLKTNVSIVGGPSAGAAMSAAAVAVLLNKKINENVTITGSVEENGFIGSVGSIAEKALAAKNAGIKTLLVPPGQSVVETPVQNCTEKKGAGWVQRECYTSFQKMNVSEEVGINIIEVEKIESALKYLVEGYET